MCCISVDTSQLFQITCDDVVSAVNFEAFQVSKADDRVAA